MALEQIAVSGRDLVVQLPDGTVLIIDDGAVFVPQLVIGDVQIPAVNVAALLIGAEPQPAAGGPQSSGGNFAVEAGDIGPGIGIGNLLPPTALSFSPPEFEEVYPALDDEEPTIIIVTPNNPDAVDAISVVDEAGLPARDEEPAGSDAASNSETATGTIVFTVGDPPATVAINGETVTLVGQVIEGEFGDLTITSIEPGEIGYSYTLADNTSGDDTAENFAMLVTDVDGDTAEATLRIDIIDDTPVANADTDSVGVAGTADGNVFTGSGGSDANATDGQADLPGADGASVTGVVAGSAGSASGNLGSALAGAHGSLTLNANGAYSYTVNAQDPAVIQLDTGETLTEVFTYSITDGDGDVSTTTLTITINGANDAPIARADTNWTQEDGPSASGNVLQTLSHPGAPSGTFGDVADTDVDVEALTVTTTGTFTGTYGTLQLNADGSYTYTLDNTNAAVQALDDGETLSEAFDYTASDGTTTASSTLTVTIFGNNDAPVANPDTHWTQEDVSLIATGNVLETLNHPGAPSGSFGDVADTDVDLETLTVTTTGDFVGTYGTLHLNADGSYTYTLDNTNAAVQALDDGETLSEAFDYTASDGTTTASSTLTVTIFGNNDAPVANADTHWTQEDLSLTAEGNVLETISHPGAPSGGFGDVADADVDLEALTVTTTGDFVGTYGTLHLNADGSYTYTLDNTNPAVQALDDGETLSEAFDYTASDGATTASSTLTVTIFGNNDAPVANPDTHWTQEDLSLLATGNVLETINHPGAPSGSFGDVADTDVDLETLTVTTTGDFVGTYGTLHLNADGSYTYTLDNTNAVVQALDDGETLSEAFDYTASDGTTTASSTLTVTIFGNNDAPVANADTHWTQEDVSLLATGNVLETINHPGAPSGTFGDAADTDVDLETLTVTTTGDFVGTYGTLHLNADGSYTYTLDNTNPAVQALDDGETVTDSFDYTASDGTTTASSTLTVTIFGNNDAPVAHADTHWTQEDGLLATGNVLETINHPGAPSGTFGDAADTDVDLETLTVTTTGDFVGTYGTLHLNADGSYTYTLDNTNPAVQALDDGETLSEAFDYTASDGTTTASSTLTVTIFGNNDAPVANADTHWTQEDLSLLATGNVLETFNHPGAPSGTFGDVADTDVDLETLTVTTAGDFVGTYGTLHLNADGSYTYTLDNTNAAVQALDDGETVTDSFDYTATDGTTTASSSLTVTVFGNNDAPVANPDTHWTQEDVSLTAEGNVLETINHPGAPSGSFGDVADTDVDLETLTVTTTGDFVGTYGTLHLNADGSYTYTLDNTNPAVQALDDGETVTDSFDYTIFDGDLTASSTLTVTIFGNNDAPVVDTGSATVSEEGLAAGHPDTDGSPDTTDAASDTDGQLTITDVDDSVFTVSLGIPTESFTSNGVTIEWSLLDSQTLIGEAGATEVIRVTIDDLGAYDVFLSAPIDHPDGSVEDQVMFVVPVAVSDGTATTMTSIDVVTVEDDSPITFTPGSTPTSGALTNVAGSTATYDLDTDGDINNNMGADQGGTITFDVTDGQDTAMTSGGDMIEYWVSDDGQTLEARTNSTDGTDGTLIFTVTLDQAGGSYTVTLSQPIDNGSGVEFADLSGGTAGNPPFKIVASTSADALELLFTPINAGSINSDSDDIAAGSQFLGFTEGLRIDFGDFTFHAHGGGSSDDAFTMASHTTVNGFRFTIDQISNGTVADVKLVAYDANEDVDKTIGTANFADDTKLAITEVKVFNAAGTLVATFTDDATIAGITADFDGVNGVTLRGLSTQYSVETMTAAGYDRIEVTNAGTGGADGKFSLSELQIAVVDFGDPVPISIPVTLTDADGDFVDADLDFTVGVAAPPVALDLNGDGVQFLSHSAGVLFDYDGDGQAEATAWVAPSDGLLAIDANGDGAVGDGSEIVFSVGGSTDLEGVRIAYDTNHDGQLSAADADFAKFGVWQDANSNGVSDAGEFITLTEAGIESLGLISDGAGYTAANGEVVVAGEGVFTYTGGAIGTLADASFAYQRSFSQTSAGYATSLAAAAMIAVAATGFAEAEAPSLNLSTASDLTGDLAAPAVSVTVAQPELTVIDAFDGGVKEAPVQLDAAHISQDFADLMSDASVGAALADAHAAPLLDATDLSPLHVAETIFVDTTVMPVIAPLAAPTAEAAAPELIAEVIADALSGGAAAGPSIDDLLSGLPTPDAAPSLLAANDFSGDALMASASAHPAAFFLLEASYLVQHDSVAVTHA